VCEFVSTLSGNNAKLNLQRSDETMTTKKTRNEKLDLRLSSSDKEKIFSAAAIARRSVSDFVLESALMRADETLADRAKFGLNAEQWEAFLTALDREPRYHPRLERLLNEPSIFEQTPET
jgi:uncharacterized protein (DUF1778 family)